MRPTTKRTSILAIVATTVVASLVAFSAPPAAAQDGDGRVHATGVGVPARTPARASAQPSTSAPTTAPSTTAPSTTSTLPTLGAGDVAVQPLSLTAILAKHQADGSGLDLSEFLKQRSAELDARLGTGSVFSSDAFTSMGGGTLTSGEAGFDQLNSRLATYSFGDPGRSSLSQMMLRLASSASTPDGASVAGGIDLARRAGAMSSPALTMPSLGRAGTILSARPDELAFGLFANQSLAKMVQNSPNLIAQVQAGQLSPASMAQFRGAMTATAANFSQGIGASLPSPCYAGMVMGVATGSAAGAGALGLPSSCAPCVTAGTYMHGRMSEMLTPGQFSSNPGDGRISQYEWQNLDPATRKAIEKLNPDLARQQQRNAGKSRGQAASASACGQAAAGTANFLTNNLSGLLGRLGG